MDENNTEYKKIKKVLFYDDNYRFYKNIDYDDSEYEKKNKVNYLIDLIKRIKINKLLTKKNNTSLNELI